MTVSRPLLQPRRLAAVAASGLTDGVPEEVFDRATRLATRLLGVPVALFSIVTDDRQVFKSHCGLTGPAADDRQTPLSHSFCQHVVDSGEPFAVEDARVHPLVATNRAVEEMGVIAYLGVPVRTRDGQVVGSFCAIGPEPRSWSDEDIAALSDVATGVESELNLRLALASLEEAAAAKDVMLGEVEHRVKNLFALVPAIVSLSARTATDKDDLVRAIRERVAALSRSHALTLHAYSEDEGVAMEALIRAVLEPYGHRSAAFALDGPTVRLPTKVSSAMALALHELATNAAKHGALSEEAGRVAISWRIEGDDLVFSWIESDGPPISGVPERRSFGTGLVDRLLEAQQGRIEREWRPEGLALALTMPVTRSS